MTPSWVETAPDTDFPLDNLPYGVFSCDGGEPRIGVAIGDRILDLRALAEAGAFEAATDALRAPVLNPFLAAGRPVWDETRRRLVELLASDAPPDVRERAAAALVPAAAAVMHLPIDVMDYVDFYSSIQHATNLGRILRPGGEPLLPNYRYLPVGYHGRSSTVVVSGTDVVRPHGQRKGPGDDVPIVGPSTALDFELELGFVTGPGNALGSSIPASAARDHIFGIVLLNDWSARDLQSWEYQPLGPFLGKSFATSISPWVVTLDALEPFRVAAPVQEPPPLDYLRVDEPSAYDIALEVDLATSQTPPRTIARTTFRDMYWTMPQQLAHMTVNGTRVRPGDLYGSGTISGSEPGTYGSLIELTWRGAQPLDLGGGVRRAFLEDGDTVTMRGRAERDAVRIGFGEVRGTVRG